MDLPTCPACGQSVLDDDVDDCPFCGASLTTGQPAKPSKPQTSPPPTPTKTEETPSSKAAAATAVGDSKEVSAFDEDDPFADDAIAAIKAVSVRRKPMKGRAHKVVCPMCETAGFIPRKAAGMDVRCANPKCLVPVFTAPEIERQPVEPEPMPKSGPAAGTIVTLAVLAVAVIGVGVWFFVFRDNKPKPGPHASANINPTGTNLKVNSVTDGDIQAAKDAQAKQDVPKPPSLTKIRQSALKMMIESSRQRDRNRSKAYCRRLTADAFASVGNLKEAQSQLAQLEVVGGHDVAFYRVVPLVSIARKELNAGRTDEANRIVEEAWRAARRLPIRGRFHLDAATVLATVLVAVGRKDDASALISAHQDSGPFGQLSFALQAARTAQTFDLESSSSGMVTPWTAPQQVAVTLELLAQVSEESALEWAQRATNDEERTECLVAWAGAVADSSARQPPTAEQLADVAKNLPAAGQARLYAAAAQSHLRAGSKPNSEAMLISANTALKSVSIPAPLVLPDMQGLFRFELPPPAPLKMAALAATEIAYMESRLNRPEVAWKSLSAAMQFLRAMAPSPPAIQIRLDEFDKLGKTALTNRFKELLRLEDNFKAKLAANEYKKKCLAIQLAAKERFGLQVSLLTRAVDWNVKDQIWDEIRTRSQQTDPAQQEPFLETALPWIIANRFRETDDGDKAKAVETVLAEFQASENEWETTKQATAAMIAGGKVGQAAARIEKSEFDKTERGHWMMRLACRLADGDEIDLSFQFITAFDESLYPGWREEALRLVSARLVRAGAAHRVWTFVEESDLPPTEKVSIYRGLIAGITALIKLPEAQEPMQEASDAESSRPDESSCGGAGIKKGEGLKSNE